MKKYIFMLVLLAATSVFAQEQEVVSEDKPNEQGQTIVGKKGTDLGFYLSPLVQGSFINDELVLVTGGQAGIMLQHNFMVGLSGKGLTTRKYFPERINNKRIDFQMGWGGLSVGYTFKQNTVVHPYAMVTLGAGVLDYARNDKPQAFFAGEIDGGVEINLAGWLRLVPYIGYRIISGGINELGLDDKKLTSFDFGVKLACGIF